MSGEHEDLPRPEQSPEDEQLAEDLLALSPTYQAFVLGYLLAAHPESVREAVNRAQALEEATRALSTPRAQVAAGAAAAARWARAVKRLPHRDRPNG